MCLLLTILIKIEKISDRKYFPLKVNVTNYNAFTDGRNYYDQSIGDPIQKYNKIRKIATGQDYYTTWCLLDYQYFKDYYQLIAFDLGKQK